MVKTTKVIWAEVITKSDSLIRYDVLTMILMMKH